LLLLFPNFSGMLLAQKNIDEFAHYKINIKVLLGENGTRVLPSGI
jgi:hypothetical protein